MVGFCGVHLDELLDEVVVAVFAAFARRALLRKPMATQRLSAMLEVIETASTFLYPRDTRMKRRRIRQWQGL